MTQDPDVPPDWTVLFIGGTSATGKTTLAEQLAERFDARYIDADLFWILLQRALPAELAPDLHAFDGESVWLTPVDDLVDRYFRVARYMCAALEPLVAHHAIIGRRVVIEGVWLLPSFAAQGTYAGVSVPGARALYLHEPDADAIEHRLDSRPSRWLQRQPDLVRHNHVAMQHRFGLALTRYAGALGYPVLDSQPFDTLLERATRALGISP